MVGGWVGHLAEVAKEREALGPALHVLVLVLLAPVLRHIRLAAVGPARNVAGDMGCC
jgi:hypothetical protein